jgi:hypothetical protein
MGDGDKRVHNDMHFFDKTLTTGFRGAFNECSWRPRALTLARRSEDRKAVITTAYLVSVPRNNASNSLTLAGA